MTPSHRFTGHHRPVFLDRSGLRRRRVVVAGAAVATTLLTGLVVLVVGFLGTSSGHVPGFPGADAPAATPAPQLSTPMPSGPTPDLRPTAAPSPTPVSAAPTPSPTSKRRVPSHPPHPSKSH